LLTVSYNKNNGMNQNASLNNEIINSAEITGAITNFQRGIAKPLLFVEIASPLDRSLNVSIKRLCDVVISTILVAGVLSWMIPLMALLIKTTSKGPIFFIQKRLKKGGRYFNCIKFRTMMINPEADLLAAYDNDRRITRPGAFLRKHHIDELPQLLNVLRGDMSLIGPRPYMISDSMKYERAADQYKLRYKVKPGITGLAQSYGHFGSVSGEHNMKERVNFDVNYITNWSLKMDLQIIWRTLWMTIKRR
jgi:putative colanic acid biosysnthesis UDP-glucose lipid carrier transferase